MLTYKQCSELEFYTLLKDIHVEYHIEQCYQIFVHGHQILRIWRDGSYSLYDGGIRSTLVKKKLNDYGPVQIIQKKGRWYWCIDKKIQGVFLNGMRVNKRGTLCYKEKGKLFLTLNTQKLEV